jgi:hypothetical protein
LKGDVYTVNVPGTIDGDFVPVGSTIRALVDSPAQISSNWAIMIYENVGKVYINDSNGEHQFYDTLTLAEAAASAGDSIYMNTDFTENLNISKDLNIIGNGHTITGRLTTTATINCKIFGVTVVHNHLTEKPLSISNSSTINALGSTFKNNLGETIIVASGSTINYGKSEEGTFRNLGEANYHDSYVPTSNLVAINNDGGILNFCKGKSVNNTGLYSGDGEVNNCIGDSDGLHGIQVVDGVVSNSKGISRTVSGSGVGVFGSGDCLIDNCEGYGYEFSSGINAGTLAKIRNSYAYSYTGNALTGYDVKNSTGESDNWTGVILGAGAIYDGCTAITHSAVANVRGLEWSNSVTPKVGTFINGSVSSPNNTQAMGVVAGSGVVGDLFILHGTTFTTNNAVGSLGIHVPLVGMTIAMSGAFIKAESLYLTPHITNIYNELPDNQGNRLI